jgi:hypothetical protein
MKSLLQPHEHIDSIWRAFVAGDECLQTLCCQWPKHNQCRRTSPHTRVSSFPTLGRRQINLLMSLLNYYFYLLWRNSGQRPPYYRGFTITLRHTTFVRTPLDEWSARRTDHYLTTHSNYKWQTSMPPAGFEPTIPQHNHCWQTNPHAPVSYFPTLGSRQINLFT